MSFVMRRASRVIASLAIQKVLHSASAVRTFLLLISVAISSRVGAQQDGPCETTRRISTFVGAGLGAAVGAIPATIVHRHDHTSSQRILVGSVAAGALIGFVASGRDRACTSRADSLPVARRIVASRSTHAGHGALAGVVIGGVLGAVGGTFYHTGCSREPCHANATRNLVVFSAAEGAAAGGILGGLIGWAWPVRR